MENQPKIKNRRSTLRIILIVAGCILGIAIIMALISVWGLISLNKEGAISNFQGDHILSKTELIDQTVQSLKKKTPLPYQIDEYTSLVGITAEPDAFRYNYVLSGIDTSKLTSDSLKNALMPNVCKEKSIRYLLDNDVIIKYNYSVVNSTDKYSMSFIKTDCTINK